MSFVKTRIFSVVAVIAVSSLALGSFALNAYVFLKGKYDHVIETAYQRGANEAEKIIGKEILAQIDSTGQLTIGITQEDGTVKNITLSPVGE